MNPDELIHFNSETQILRAGNKEVVEVWFSVANYRSRILMDRATAAKLINQLRRVLDEEYNNRINEFLEEKGK